MDPLAELSSRAGRAGLFLDFDGTLSEIVERPSDARPAPGVAAALEHVARRFALVAVVSGRSAAELLEWLGPGVEIWGVHGAEHTDGGRVVPSERVAPFHDLMRRVVDEASAAVERLGLSGAVVEDKGVMTTLHYRAAADRAAAERALDDLASELARRHGLVRAEGRMAFELRPPAEFSKRLVVLDRVHALGLVAAAFVGDDVVDLPAFDALDELERDGVVAVRVAVDSDEAPPEVLARADVVVHGPAGVVSLLEDLAAR